jgi:hypothetical protein
VNVHMTKEQLTDIIATLEWSAKTLVWDTKVLGLEPELREFAEQQAEKNMDLARMLEEQR